MSTIDGYETYEAPRRHKSHRHREREYVRDEPRYVEKQETFVRASPAPAAPDPPYTSRQTELIRRPVRGDSDLSIEEVRREFPPPTSATYTQQRSLVRDDRYGPPRRAHSAERERQYQVYADPRRSGDIVEERRSRRTLAADEHSRPRQRSLSRNQKIIAAVGGAALAVGGKELFDRRQSHGAPIERNPLGTAAIGAAGALAAYEGAELYAKHGPGAQEKVKTYMATNGRNGPAEYYSSEEESVRPKRSKSKSRRKSIVEGALGLAGLGAAAGASRGRSERGSRRGRDDSYDSFDSRRSRSRGPNEGAAKFQQAAKAALLAGAAEAFRVRNEPGGWGAEKGKRILTAAIGAGGIDAAADRDPDRKSKRHILEAVVGGLAGNRLINGSRNEVDDGRSSHGGRARSRSRSRGPGGGGSGGLAALATAGIGALASKKLLDNHSERSRSRSKARRRRSPSGDSYDSRSPSPRRGDRRHRRSKSVTDYARKGLAAIGLSEGADADRDRRRGDVIEETRITKKKSRRGGSDDGYDGGRRSRRGGDADYSQSRGVPYGEPYYADSRGSDVGSQRNGGGQQLTARQRDGVKNRKIAEGKKSDSSSDSDLGSSDEDERNVRKMKGKQFLTAGLAAVATIHAAHNVYQSMEKRDARHKAVKEGEMSPEEAKRLKMKSQMQDVASIGIAALGIKGALSELKEVREVRHEFKEMETKKEERHKKRLERQKKNRNGAEGGRHRADNWSGGNGDDRYQQGPRYLDANPYSAGLPAPPVGYQGR